MIDTSSPVKSYFDMSGLNNLKAQARSDGDAAAKDVGKQFEAMFLQMVFKSMREANEPMKSGLMSSAGLDAFEQMFHEEISQAMSQNGAIGMGDWLANQVQSQTKLKKAADVYKETERSFGLQDHQLNTEASKKGVLR
jgi:flagellar protein FlgJ